MPVVFLGHGSPLNALRDNGYTRAWHALAARLPRPRAILVVSAHWVLPQLAVTAMAQPRTIHDFRGFPPALHAVRYPAPGAPALAERTRELLAPLPVAADHDWGLDHGTWSLLLHLFPQADVPVVQLAIEHGHPPAWYLETSRRLAPLREEGVLILGSGNVVHNLRTMVPGNDVAPHSWAARFNERVRAHLLRRDFAGIADYRAWGPEAALAVPTDEHFLPLLHVLGACREDEPLEVVTDGIVAGSIGMLGIAAGLAAGATA